MRGMLERPCRSARMMVFILEMSRVRARAAAVGDHVVCGRGAKKGDGVVSF